MRIAVDATPAVVQRGGVGRYTRELLRVLVQETLDHKFILSVAAGDADTDELLRQLPPGAWREARRLPASERIMTAIWHRARLPVSVERWIGSHAVYHGTDFTLPPTRAAGVVTIHDLSFLLHPEYSHPELARYLQNVVPRSVARADAVITVSASVAAEVASAYPDARRKIVAIPNGVAHPASPVAREAASRPTILMVGTVEPRKNHLAVIQAMTGVRAGHPDARLLVVGRRGWRDDEIMNEIKRGQAEGWLTWIEDASDDDLEAAYGQATLFVSASHYEGFGLPLLEAMTRGLPCVASEITAHREVATDSVAYVDSSKSESIAARITGLLDDAEARDRLADAGRTHAERYSWHETARRTLRVYESAASGESR